MTHTIFHFIIVSLMVLSPFTTACDSDGGTCTCGSDGNGNLITLNRFWGDKSDEKVWGCGGAFALQSASIDASAELSDKSLSKGVNVGLDFGTEPSYYGWEGCCAVCGTNLEALGFLSSGWYCDKDLFSTGIWLIANHDAPPKLPVPNPVPLPTESTEISDLETCYSGDVCATSSYTCCTAPADIGSGKSTCRPLSDCETASTGPAGVLDWETCYSGDVCASSSYTCCTAPADIGSGKSTCCPQSDCA
jgi:hypothetical protein